MNGVLTPDLTDDAHVKIMASAATQVNLGPVVSAIICKTTSGKDKVKAYNQFTNYLKESSGDSFDNVVLEIKHQLWEIIPAMNKDIGGNDPQVALAALQCLGFILWPKDITRALNSAQTLSIIDTLCQTIINTTDKHICTRTLWCLAKQDMSKSIIENELEKILEAIEYGQCKKNMQSMTVEHEALNATIRLLEQVPVAMKPHTLRWGKLVYPLLVHGAPRLRERAMVAMETGMSAMLEHQEELAKLMIPDLQSLLIKAMSKLMADKKENEVFVLQVWQCYVKILGKSLHHGVFINSLLPIVETGFKNAKVDVRIEAYRCWQTLIDNFAENADIVSDYKRVKLIMQVFKVGSAKYESVAIEKLRVWWHFLNKLGEKNSQYFEWVCVPLLEYAIKGVITGNSFTPAPKTPLQRIVSGGLTSPPGQSTPKINPTTPGGSTPIVFPAVQKLGAQVIALILGKTMNSPELPKARFTLEPLSHDIISSGTFFIKHATVLINAVKQCIMDLGEQIQDGILYHLWYNLVARIKNAIESSHKKEGADAFKLFLESLGDIVQAQSLQPVTILKLVQALFCLPQKVLASSTYHVSGASSDVMQVSLEYQGCPAVYLVGILCHHRIIETCGANERFFTILEKLIAVGLNSSASLEFCQSCLQHVEKAAPQADSKECVWRMWSMITNPLHSHLLKTQEVNQGNTLEHDFSCLYIALHLPIKHLIRSTLPQPTLKTVLRSWRDLYSTFSRLAALVTNAEANVCCEALCARIVSGIGFTQLEDVVFVESMSHICQFMVTAIDYSGFSNMSILHSISPSSFSKKKAQPLGNLTSLVELCNKLMTAILEHHVSMQKSSGAQQAVVCLVGVTETLYNHLPTSGLLAALTAALGPALARLMGSNKSKIFTPNIASKFEALWLSIVISLESRYTAPFDSEMLRIMSPLLEVTFLHPKRAIKNQTLTLWNSTFGRSAPLKYPDSLKSVLAAVKEKSVLQLPGWDSAEVVMVAPARDSQMTQGGESQISIPNITGLKSPVKTIGSFLNRDLSPNIKKSPLVKTPSKSPRVTGTPSNAKKNLSLNSLDLMKKDDFVVIPAVPPKRGRRVLTEHQKDVMREHRREGPGVAALYSAVEVSMDATGASLMGFSDTQMTEASCSNTLDTPQIEITPFPFFPKLLKDEAKEKETKTEVMKSKSYDTPQKSDEKTSDEQSPAKRTRGRPKKRKSVRFSADSDPSDMDTESVNTLDEPENKSKSDAIKPRSGKPTNDAILDSEEMMTSASSEPIVCDSDKNVDSVIIIGDSDEKDNSESKNVESEKISKESEVIIDTATQLFDSAKDSCKKLDGSIDETQDTSHKNKNMVDHELLSSPKSKQLKIDDILSPTQVATITTQGPSVDSNTEVIELPSPSELSQSQTSVIKRRTRASRSSSQGTGSQARRRRSNSLESPLKKEKSLVMQKSPAEESKSEAQKTKDPTFFVNTLDKWVLDKWKSKDSGKVANGEKFSSSLPSKKLSSSFLLGSEVEEKVLSSSAPPVVMVEESQQFSPSKFKGIFRSPTEANHSVQETPVKDEPMAISVEEANNASKVLFDGDAKDNCKTDAKSDEVVPESQEELFDSLNKTKSDKDSEGSFVEDAEQAKPVEKGDAVVKLQKLSPEEIQHRLNRRSGMREWQLTKKVSLASSSQIKKPFQVSDSQESLGFVTPGVEQSETCIENGQQIVSESESCEKEQKVCESESVAEYETIPESNFSVNLSQTLGSNENQNEIEKTSDLENNSGIEPMEVFTMSEDSDATVITKPRRHSKPPSWMNNMKIESPNQKRLDAESPQSKTPSTPNTGGKKRGRPRKLQKEAAFSESQSIDSEDTDNEKSKKTLKMALLNPTLSAEINESTDSDLPVNITRKHSKRRSSLKLQKKGSIEVESANESKVNKEEVQSSEEKSKDESEILNHKVESNEHDDSPQEKVEKEQEKETKKRRRRSRNNDSNESPSCTSNDEIKPECKTDQNKKHKQNRRNSKGSSTKDKEQQETNDEVLNAPKDELSSDPKTTTSNVSESDDDNPLTLLSTAKDSLDLVTASLPKSSQSQGLNVSTSEDDNIPLKEFAKPPAKKRKVSIKKSNKKSPKPTNEKNGMDEPESLKTMIDEIEVAKAVVDQPEVTKGEVDQPEVIKADLHVQEESALDMSQDSLEDIKTIKKEMTNIVQTSTPRTNSPGNKKRKKISLRQKQFVINTSPLGKRLRSSGVKLRSPLRSKSTLNKSLDSALHKIRRKRKRTDSTESPQKINAVANEVSPVKSDADSADAIVDKDSDMDCGESSSAKACTVSDKCENKDSEISDHAGEDVNKNKIECDVNSKDVCQASKSEVADNVNAVDKNSVVPAADEEHPIPAEVLTKPTVSTVVKLSPRKSPPKKGKPFDMPETPKSVNRLFPLCRSGIILQKSLTRQPSQSSTPQPSSLKNRIFKSPSKPAEKSKHGILKNSPPSQSPEKNITFRSEAGRGSPPSGFRPIHLPRVYSPSASPSAGILKKRQLSGDFGVNSPSPPNKQRRVSFAEETEVRHIAPRRDQTHQLRPSSPKPVNRCLDLPKQSPLAAMADKDAKADGASKQSDSEAKSSFEASETQTQAESSNVSTQESQLSTEGPVFLPLVDCHVPVEQVLPQLTSSMWMRGLGQLVRAKSIRTVGDLSKLTEYDVNMLPVKAPKVKTVRAVLANFQQTLNSKAPGNGAAATAKGEQTAAERSPASETASADDKDDKSALETSLPLDADDNQNTSTDLLDEIKQLEDSMTESNNTPNNTSAKPFGDSVAVRPFTKFSVSTNSEKPVINSSLPRPALSTMDRLANVSNSKPKENIAKSPRKFCKKFMANMDKLVEQSDSEDFKQMPLNNLLQLQQRISTLTNNMVLAFSDKWPSSPAPSQSSQESQE